MHVCSKSNKAGFGLIEVIMATLIITGLMAVTMEVLTASIRNNRSLALDQEYRTLINGVSSAISRHELCQNTSLIGLTFVGASSVPMSLPSITVSTTSGGTTTTTPLVQTGQYVPGLNITSISIDSIVSDATVGPSAHEYFVNLSIIAQKGDNVFVGRKNFSTKLKVALTTNTTTNLVTGCDGSADGPTLADTCNATGGIFNPTTNTCDLAKPVCTQSGGTWNTATGTCDHSNNQYAIQTPSSGGVHTGMYTQTSMCTSGDIATGGAAQVASPTDQSTAMPIYNASSQAVGWTCTGTHLVSCQVLCYKPLQAGL